MVRNITNIDEEEANAIINYIHAHDKGSRTGGTVGPEGVDEFVWVTGGAIDAAWKSDTRTVRVSSERLDDPKEWNQFLPPAYHI